ncbi:MAG: alpha-L-glutamate ligase-like protein [Deltaproteobacteria bacterium]|nr:alpha-L-glutamate ligase-like protein [Deltaproteobacteria bacterium]MBW2543045.1 alpha-L-glutamate ligase-like protein [Deltaproteobacteria bacterium]
MKVLNALRSNGVLGINGRNAAYTLRWNPRRLYPMVDDKLRTKRLCEEAGIPVPRLIAYAGHHFEIKRMLGALEGLDDFVLKPARGAMGNGIIVIHAREGDAFLRPGGRRVSLDDLRYHAGSIISGLYALGGHADAAMLEERLVAHPILAAISEEGAPDVRIVVFRGIPVMAMTRLPTRRSSGRANLHQGAVGAGVGLSSGRIEHAMVTYTPVERHPDSDRPLIGVEIPGFSRALEIAVRATDETGLGYVGADVVIDARLGPVILELNARPGLAIQVANQAGLLPRLRAVEEDFRPGLSVEERIEMGRQIERRAP